MTLPDFSASQTELTRARAAQLAAEAAVAQANEARKRLELARDRLARRLSPNDPAAMQEAARLSALLERANADLASAQAVALRATTAAQAAFGTFATFTDPRRNIGLLSDRWPFALLPVRIETRFVTVANADNVTGEQLWVRIYPDDCSVDTFEPVLSATELANAQRYWEMVWSAAGIEDQQRNAWRRLVTAHGSGRASWIVDQYQPTNLTDISHKARATDQVLVIPTQAPLAAAEAAAVAAYWQAIWLADDNLAARQAARSALNAAVGVARADQLIAAYQPFNQGDKPVPPVRKSDVGLATAFVVFPPDPPTKQEPWTQAPRVHTLADRFVVLGYIDGALVVEAVGGPISLPLIVGPDPSAPPAGTIHPQDGDLFVPDELRWLVDFDQAVAVGMGLRINLTPQQAASGFDRLIVLGLQLSSNPSDGQTALEDLLRHHHFGRSGLSVVPQGTPTHNSATSGSGQSGVDDADGTFDDRKQPALFVPTQDPLSKSDGQWLAELLGIDSGVFAQVHNAGGADQTQARAMQRALWPATLGYWMDKMLTPVFDDATVESTRWFFTNYVSGRGACPAVRIGGQPYGVLPTTAFSRIAWLDDRPQQFFGFADQRAFLAGLLRLLRAIDADWTSMSSNASYVDKPGDAHRILLDILGLHPDSVEFHSRYAESLTELFNTANLGGFGPNFWQAILALGLQAAGSALLPRLGYSGASQPDILQHVFLRDANQIANVVDDRPLSESATIREYTDDHRNYIRWLIDAARTSLDAVTQEQGFSGDRTPETLLYLFLRHAIMLGYYDASYNLHRTSGILSAGALLAMKPEPVFIHVADAPASESRFAALYKTEARITSSPTQTVADYISENLLTLFETRHLSEQLSGLAVLTNASTASLERAFAEHIDCCSYRFDAWLLGLVAFHLQTMRYVQEGDATRTQTGVYLGAYGWLENLRRSTAQLTPVELPGDLAKVFADGAPLLRDASNGGFIHAPSLAHARTAAVLRSGYLANATPTEPGIMTVNLSSDRVRLALSMLEGIRNGQTLGALLGYRFERGLHDDHALAEVDKFIFPLRKAFPLAADALAPTKTLPDTPIEAIEARNVLDGLKLVAQIRTSGVSSYPFGVTTPPLPAAGPAETTAIDKEAQALVDAYDAIGDLALAEGVHQAVQGNFERIAATLDAYSTGHFPPEPEVVQTPPGGIGLTHRVAVHLHAGLGPPVNPTPRASAEPAVDAWLASILPTQGSIGCHVTWTDPATGTAQSVGVTLADLGLHPLDLIDVIRPVDAQAMSELDDRILLFVVKNVAPRPDADLRIGYMHRGGAAHSIFEVAPLVRSLKAVLTGARPLQATDARLHGEAAPEQDNLVFVDRGRIAGPKLTLDTLSADIAAFLGTLMPLLADTAANRAAIVAGVDAFVHDAVDLLARAAEFGLPSCGWGFALDWKRGAFKDTVAELRSLVDRWDARLVDYDARIIAYDGLPAATPDAQRFAALQAAKGLISTTAEPLPATPAVLRAALNARRAAFVARRNQFHTILVSNTASVATLLSGIQALLPVAQFDTQPLDLTPIRDRAFAFASDLATNLKGHLVDVDARRTATQVQLAAHDASASATTRVQTLQAAANALLGPDFHIIPEFELAPAQGAEWANAVAAGSSGELLNYLTTTAAIDFPVDEWLYGVARVRPNLRAWEATVVLAGAFQRPEPRLVPMQLPYAAGAPWLALEYPPDYPLDSDRLLYTAQYVTPFDATSRQCGLLLDEWTEVIPAADSTTGITFNFDRPNSEPPQTILLVTPASASGTWQWDDLVGALNETLDLARKRALEPVHIDNTAYSRFLPATIMAATVHGISISTSLAAANGVFRSLERVNA